MLARPPTSAAESRSKLLADSNLDVKCRWGRRCVSAPTIARQWSVPQKLDGMWLRIIWHWWNEGRHDLTIVPGATARVRRVQIRSRVRRVPAEAFFVLVVLYHFAAVISE